MLMTTSDRYQPYFMEALNGHLYFYQKSLSEGSAIKHKLSNS